MELFPTIDSATLSLGWFQVFGPDAQIQIGSLGKYVVPMIGMTVLWAPQRDTRHIGPIMTVTDTVMQGNSVWGTLNGLCLEKGFKVQLWKEKNFGITSSNPGGTKPFKEFKGPCVRSYPSGLDASYRCDFDRATLYDDVFGWIIFEKIFKLPSPGYVGQFSSNMATDKGIRETRSMKVMYDLEYRG